MAVTTFLLIVCGLWSFTAFRWVVANRALRMLPQSIPPPAGPLPRLSVIVAACNEGDTIEDGLGSLRTQGLKDLEIIVVNDRSTDATGEILSRLAADDDRIQPVSIDTLPDGWLGKVHALHQGTARATGSWLLFTDADVIFEEDALACLLAYAIQQDLDHLTLMPHMVHHSVGLEVAIYSFLQILIHGLGWGLPIKPKPFGAGAFNLVRKTTFDRTPGFEWIKMEVADDAGLALMLDDVGAQSQARLGPEWLKLMWYPSLAALIHGLSKNAFLMLSHGSWSRGVPLLIGGWVLVTVPILAPLLSPTVAVFWASGFAIGAHILTNAYLRYKVQRPLIAAALAPLGPVIMMVCLTFSAWHCLKNRGVIWRGTRYPWGALTKGQRVKF